MKCPNCNHENHHNNKVCGKCGAPIASTPHEKHGVLRCPACGCAEIEKITMYKGKVVDPHAKKGLFDFLKKNKYETVRKCTKCGKDF